MDLLVFSSRGVIEEWILKMKNKNHSPLTSGFLYPNACDVPRQFVSQHKAIDGNCFYIDCPLPCF